MEQFLVTPVKNVENENSTMVMEINSPVNAKDKEIEIIKEKLPHKRISPTLVLNKNVKIKKIKMRQSRGEKRKFPDMLDSAKKIKKKKREETLFENEPNLCKKFKEVQDKLGTKDSSASMKSVLHCERVGIETGIDTSDGEDGEKVVRPRSSRKCKAIASNCRETLNILLELGADVLCELDKSLKILKNHNLLSNKYIPMDTLIDLIALALKKSRIFDNKNSEKELFFIISKYTNGSCTTAKRSKMSQPVSPKNTVLLKEATAGSSLANVADLRKEKNEVNWDESRATVQATEKSETSVIVEKSERQEETTVEKSGKNFCITNYFKKLKKNVEERDKNERFSSFIIKTDMFLAPKLGGELKGERRDEFEHAFKAQNSKPHSYIAELLGRPKVKKSLQANRFGGSKASCTPQATGGPEKNVPFANARTTVAVVRSTSQVGGATHTEHLDSVCHTKAKLLQFHDNRRPPYWGTWRKKSAVVGPRRPLAKDAMFNYEIDSDEEWEEEEAGESLHGSDEEKEPDEDYEVDNDFFVPHGYLSDDENPEENSSSVSKLNVLEEQFTSEQKQKMRKMTPVVFGIFWMHQKISEGTFYQDSQVEKLQYVSWVSTPVEIEEPEEFATSAKKTKQKVFPEEEIPELIKMIHGSPHNCDRLARQFLLSRTASALDAHRPELTKVCVQKKIRELAAWQAGQNRGKMCWQVSRETRREFGADDLPKSPETHRKCFIWKFVRRAAKSSETKESPLAASPPHSPSSSEPELLILES